MHMMDSSQTPSWLESAAAIFDRPDVHQEIEDLGRRISPVQPPATPEEVRAARILWLRSRLFDARIQVDGLEAMLRALDAEEL